MTDSRQPENTALNRRIAARVQRLLALARWTLLWETLWPALWPAVCIAGLFLALSGLDALPLLPAWLHLIVLIVFAASFLLVLLRAVRGFHSPGRGAAARRLERDSGIDHRPLVVLNDRLGAGTGDAGSERLWQLHRQRAAAAVRTLRVALPRPGLAGHDPRALRFAVLLALVVGIVAGYDDPMTRLARAVAPDLSGAGGIPAATLEIWVTPPEYTGLPPRLLINEKTAGAPPPAGDATTPGAIEVPAGSQILAQLNDGHGEPALRIGEDTTPFSQIADRAWRIEIAANAAGQLRRQTALTVTQGGKTLADWQLIVVADETPEIEFAKPPEASRRNALSIEYRAHDDFGIASVVARLTRPQAEATLRDSPLELHLPTTSRNMRDGGTITFHDLTAHPWAGLTVDIQLEARDSLEQTGRSDRLALTLPERTFNHPVAREIIDQRRLLTLAPDDRLSVAEGLQAIALRPGRYDEDLVVYMALMLSRSRLVHDRTGSAIESTQELLWDTALRIEDGALSLAESDIRELQRRLQDALARDAGDEEIRELTEQLRNALDRLFQALSEQLQRQIENGELTELDPNAQTFDRADLDRMLDQIEQLSQTGAREAAQQLLSQMQRMLESLRNGQFAKQRQGSGNPQAQQMMRDLQDILRRQQELQDRSFQQSRQNERSGEGDAAAQESLRRQLGDLMRRLGEMTGEIPAEFGDAEQAMRRAGEALERGSPGNAVGPQGEALDLLRQGAQGAMQALRGGNGPGQDGGFENTGRPGQNRDPLGRPLPGTFGSPQTTGFDVPDAGELQRAREILDELRSRAGDRSRPVPELEYLERLLRRF